MSKKEQRCTDPKELQRAVDKEYKSHPNLKEAPDQYTNHISEEPGKFIQQGSSYGDGNRCSPNNNIFWEDRSNHLSSKGD